MVKAILRWTIRGLVSVALASAGIGSAQTYTTITATGTIQNGFSLPLAAGTICFSPYNSSGVLTGIQPGGSGPVTTGPFCGAVALGSINLPSTIPNLATGLPSGLNYQVTVYDTAANVITTIYGTTQMTGTTFDWNALLVGPITLPGLPSMAGVGSPYPSCSVAASYTRTDKNPMQNWACVVTPGGQTQWTSNGIIPPIPGPNQTATVPVVNQMIQDALGHVTGAVVSFKSRAGAVVPASGDYSFDLISGAVAPSQLPAFTAAMVGAAGTLSNNTSGRSATTGAFDHTPTACGAGTAIQQIGATGNPITCIAAGGGGPGGGVDPGPQSTLPFYPSTIPTALVGPSQITTDTATQSTLTVPTLLTSQQRIVLNPNHVNTTGSIGSNQPYTQDFNQARLQGGSWNLGNLVGNVGPMAYVGFGYNTMPQISQRGIHQMYSGFMQKFGVGDSDAIYLYNHCATGLSALSDEGCGGMGLQTIEDTNYFKGTIASTSGTGDPIPVLAHTDGQPLSDGAYLLDISKGTLTGRATGITQISMTGNAGTFPTFLFGWTTTGVTFPKINKAGLAFNLLVFNGQTRDAPTSQTITIEVLQNGSATFADFAPGDKVWVVGSNGAEQSSITAAPASVGGFQNITLMISNPFTQAYILSSDLVGNYTSFDENLAVSGMRTSYLALGSFDGTTLIFGSWAAGNYNTVPDPHTEAAKVDGSTASIFHLYPGAEVVGNYNFQYGVRLEQNFVPWAAGDVVENPNYPSQGGISLAIVKTQQSPTRASAGNTVIQAILTGAGITGPNFNILHFLNTNNITFYEGGGGQYATPNGIELDGPFGFGLKTQYGPDAGSSFLSYSNHQSPSGYSGLDSVLNAAGIDLDADFTNNRWQTNFMNILHMTGETVAVSGDIVTNGGDIISEVGGVPTGKVQAASIVGNTALFSSPGTVEVDGLLSANGGITVTSLNVTGGCTGCGGTPGAPVIVTGQLGANQTNAAVLDYCPAGGSGACAAPPATTGASRLFSFGPNTSNQGDLFMLGITNDGLSVVNYITCLHTSGHGCDFGKGISLGGQTATSFQGTSGTALETYEGTAPTAGHLLVVGPNGGATDGGPAGGGGSTIISTTTAQTIPSGTSCSDQTFTFTGLTSTMAVFGSAASGGAPGTSGGPGLYEFYNTGTPNLGGIYICAVVGGSSPSITFQVRAN